MKFFIFFRQKGSCIFPMVFALCFVLTSVKVWSSGSVLSGLGSVLQNQGFESWDNNLPQYWFGSASSIAEASVYQSAEAHSGEYSCRLVRTQKGHVRFSSASLALTAGLYRLSYYVKGGGCIRNSYYNGASYASYSDYDTLSNDQQWKYKVYEFELKKDADVQLLYSLCSTDTVGLFIDDVLFENIASNLDDNQLKSPSVWIVPEGLSIDLPELSKLILYDMLGRTIFNEDVEGYKTIALSRGVYLLKIGNRSSAIKLYIP